MIKELVGKMSGRIQSHGYYHGLRMFVHEKTIYTINSFMLLQPKIKPSMIKMNEFCDKHIDIAKLRYRKKYFDDYKDNSRKQWQMINEMLSRHKSNIRVNKLIDKDGKVHNTPTAIAENFNEYFANIASNLKNEIVNRSDVTAGESYKKFLQQPVENELCLSNVSPHEVHKVVKNFKNKSTLDTKISALKIANNSLNFTSILAKIINKSFNEGVFP